MKTGEIHQVFSSDELDKIISVMSALPLSEGRNDTQNYASTRGIGPGHSLYSWFVKKYFCQIQNLFPEHKLGLSMVKYNDGTEPEKLHSDYYTNRGLGQSFKTMLIPISVNNNRPDLDRYPVHTVIFDQTDTCVGQSGYWSDREWLNQRQIKPESALQYKEQYLSHLNDKDLACLTVWKIWRWQYGSMFYWNESLLHSSDNFKQNGIVSKQALVMHTHVLQ